MKETAKFRKADHTFVGHESQKVKELGLTMHFIKATLKLTPCIDGNYTKKLKLRLYTFPPGVDSLNLESMAPVFSKHRN